MFYAGFKPKMMVPDYIQQIARELIRKRSAEDHQAFLTDLARGLVDADKWNVPKDEDWLQF